ncbi:MAG: ATP-binding protein [bacterium]
MLYKRKIYNKIKKTIRNKEIIILTGMRRVGKTTLYKMFFNEIMSKNKIFLDLENPIEQKIFEEQDYNNIIFNFKEYGLNLKSRAYVFIDEIQAMPEVVKAIKYLYDHYDIKFFLTGSSSYYLKNFFPESLAGRKIVFELFPLDFEEFLIFKSGDAEIKKFYKNFKQKTKNKNLILYEKTKKYYDEYLNHGGFPEVVLSENKDDKFLKLQDIFKSYFEKDVKVLADFKEIKVFRDLILLLMQRVGSKIEITKLSAQLSVSRETIYSYLSFLEQTYFVNFISPFSKNVDREVSGSKKVYLCDNGLLNYFAKASEGALFENSVFLNLRKYGVINYYQKRTGSEIDFILNQKIAIEAKIKGSDFDYKKLKKISDFLSMQQSYLATMHYNDKPYSILGIDL